MLDKKVKASLGKNVRDRSLGKAKALGNNAPVNKYYQEQIRPNSRDINGL